MGLEYKKISTASFVLTSAQNTRRSIGGHFIGISEDGMPLFTHGEAFLEKTSRYHDFLYRFKILFKLLASVLPGNGI